MKQRILVSLTLILLCLPLLYPFIQSGFFPTHDGEWAIVRLTEMVREIKDLQIPPRMSTFLNHGFGYPLFLFTYPFPYYLGSFLHLLGLGYVSSIKILFIFSVLGSAVSMYIFTSKLWGKWGGLLSATLYIYAPYRLVNLYIRGSLGESFTFVLLPLIFLGFYELYAKPAFKWMCLGAFGLALLIITHNAMALLFAPFLVFWLLILYFECADKIKFSKFILVTLGVGIALSAYFWLPVIIEKKYISLNKISLTNISDNFVTIQELINSKWSLDSVRPPLQLGVLHTFLFIGTIVLIFIRKNKLLLQLFFIFSTIITIFLILPFSYSYWKLPLFKEIDFPWRMLGISMFMLSVSVGSISKLLFKPVMSCLIVMSVIVYNLQYIQTQPLVRKSDEYYETNDATTTSADELMPVWVHIKPKNRAPDLAVFINPMNTNVFNKKILSDYFSFSVQSKSSNTLIVNQVYFPGWDAYVDSKKRILKITENTGLMSLNIENGYHTVELKFNKTPVRIISDLLSLSALLTIVGICLYSKKLFQS